MRDNPKTTPSTQRFLSNRRSTIIAWFSWEDSDYSDSPINSRQVTNSLTGLSVRNISAATTDDNMQYCLCKLRLYLLYDRNSDN